MPDVDLFKFDAGILDYFGPLRQLLLKKRIKCFGLAGLGTVHAGIGQGLIRVAVGLEHIEDIEADLTRGLDTLT